jgi:hypothetical protein
MISRHPLPVRVLATAALCVAIAASAVAEQVTARPVALPVPTDTPVPNDTPVVAPGQLSGLVRDDRGQPLAGAVVSALGATTAFAVSDKDGRFFFRRLPPGPYLVRVHLQGYQPARARALQIAIASKTASTITMSRLGEPVGGEAVLAAGVSAPAEVEEPDAEDTEHEHGELAWRLRHQKRSVLRQVTRAGEPDGGIEPDDSPWRTSLAGLGRAVNNPVRNASGFFADLAVDGQVNLLTSASLERPQDLLLADTNQLRGVALMSLEAPGTSGTWRLRGALTQGDLSSWLVAGSFVRTAPSSHEYEAGFSYGMQRYLGGSAATLASMGHDSRAVATMYAYDTWTPHTRVRVGYGSEYATQDYLGDDALVSPRLSVSVQPFERDSFTLRGTASRREVAPGAEEFVPPSAGVWMPPQRTFSAISANGALRPERVDGVEFAAERAVTRTLIVGVRAFRQRGEDQVVAFFGPDGSGATPSPTHYLVGSAGDFDATGWGLRVGSSIGEVLRASVDYTQADAVWSARASDRLALASLARTSVREHDRMHDVTASLESHWAPTATRIVVLYKVSSAVAADAQDHSPALVGTRFNVQVSQGLPFLRFTNTRWEALVAVRNVFHDDVLNGSVYDELLVVRPPLRVLGGVTVRF